MAHWIIEDKGFGGSEFQCSNCGDLWNDIFHSGVGCWKKCPSCGEEMDERSDVMSSEERLDDEREYVEEKKTKQLANSFKNITESISKATIAYQNMGDAIRRIDENVMTLEQVSGMSIENLIKLFSAEWVLTPPPTTYSTSSPNYKFDTELLKRQLEEFEKKRYSEWPYWGRCEFEKRRGEESIKDMMRRAGYF